MTELSKAAMYERGDDLASVVPEVVLTDEVLDPYVTVKFIGHTSLSEYWCPYCGGWHGGGSPPRSEAVQASPIPDVLKKVVGLEVTVEGRWERGGAVDGQPAKVRANGKKLEALWGGEKVAGDGPRHGHIISNDGMNANFVAEPGADGLARDIPVDDRRLDPYDQSQLPTYTIDETTGGYNFS